MKTFFFWIISIIYLHAQSTEVVHVGYRFDIEIPAYFVRTYDINEDALLQYYNLNKEAYFLIFQQEKAMLKSKGFYFADIKDYAENLFFEFQKNSRNRVLYEIQTFKIQSSLNVAQAELTFTGSDGKDLFFLLSVIETEHYYFRFFSWTILPNKSALLPDFKAMISSFKQ